MQVGRAHGTRRPTRQREVEREGKGREKSLCLLNDEKRNSKETLGKLSRFIFMFGTKTLCEGILSFLMV
jgi:hypothetical protein